MVKVGFICEGECERIMIESDAFQDLLKRLNLDCVFPIKDANGNGNLLPHNIQIHLAMLKDAGAEKIIILTDLDADACTTNTKNRITKNGAHKIDNGIIIVAVKELEAWYLADNVAMSNLLKKNHSVDNPQNFDNPMKGLSDIHLAHTGRGLGVDSKGAKPRVTRKILEAGFSIENAAKHPNCASAAYFLNKLSKISITTPS